MAQDTAAAVPGTRVAASVVSTAPATTATKNAYRCSQPRILGLPRSTGRSRVWVVVTASRLRHRRLLVSRDVVLLTSAATVSWSGAFGRKGETRVGMSVSSRRTGSGLTVAVSGEVDLSTTAQLENSIMEAVLADG